MNLSKKIFPVLLSILTFSFALNPFSGIDLNIIRILIPLFFIIWLGESLLHKKIFIDTRPRFFFLCLFLLIVFFSFFWATESQRAWRKILFLFSVFPIYLITFDLFKNNFSKNNFLKIILATSLIQSVLGIFQFLLQFLIGINTSLNFWGEFSVFFLGKSFGEKVVQYSSWMVNIEGKTLFRAFGTFPDPHLFGLFISLSIPISWYFFKKTKQIFYLIIIFLQLIAIALSFSRSSYLAIISFVLIIFTLEFYQKIKQKKIFWFYVASLFLILFIFLSPNIISKRLNSSFNLNEGSNQGRIAMWKKGAELIKENPWTGVGIGNFSYQIKPSSNFREPIYAHNLFLDFGSEVGIFSILLLFSIFLCVFFNFSFQGNKLKNTIVYFFVIFFVFSLFETPFYSIRIFPLFLIFLAIPNEKN